MRSVSRPVSFAVVRRAERSSARVKSPGLRGAATRLIARSP